MRYNRDEQAIIWLSHFEFITYKKMCDILSLVEYPADLLESFNDLEYELKDIVGTNITQLIEFDEEKLKNTIENLEKSNIFCITQYSENYPSKLMEVESPPYILYCKGDASLLNKDSIAIVGTRKPTNYGKQVTTMFAKELTENGYVIVSGLAYGVDTIAHTTTLENHGKTIAVLGGGFNHIYPTLNTNLANNIIENGLIITEYPPSIKPTAYSFPFRNRIIAGLAKGVLITEASEKSGSLHTKEYALDCGREVFAVPGNITSSNSAGTNRIIKSANVACVTCVEDILLCYGDKIQQKKKEVVQLDIVEMQIVNLIKNEEKSFDEIQITTGIDAKTLNRYLTTLQLRGIINKLPGNLFVKI